MTRPDARPLSPDSAARTASTAQGWGGTFLKRAGSRRSVRWRPRGGDPHRVRGDQRRARRVHRGGDEGDHARRAGESAPRGGRSEGSLQHRLRRRLSAGARAGLVDAGDRPVPGRRLQADTRLRRDRPGRPGPRLARPARSSRPTHVPILTVSWHAVPSQLRNLSSRSLRPRPRRVRRADRRRGGGDHPPPVPRPRGPRAHRDRRGRCPAAARRRCATGTGRPARAGGARGGACSRDRRAP
jgi:hypothetical protein